MKIIDTKTGKRVGKEQKDINVKLKEKDPILRNAVKEEDAEFSPMDPPEAYETEKAADVAKEDMHPLLQQYMDEHVNALAIIERFEKGLIIFKEEGYNLTDSVNEAFREFFDFFDSGLLDHNRREERQFFPLLHKRLIEVGEHSEGDDPTTAVDMMEDDHVKFIQLGALAFNLLGLAARLRDPGSKAFTYDTAFNNAQELIEMIRLHIYREDNVLFPLAHKLISKEEMDRMT